MKFGRNGSCLIKRTILLKKILLLVLREGGIRPTGITPTGGKE
jgi:hypothetical protein